MLRKATNLALFVYDAACLVMVLLGTPKPPYSCDSCMRMSTHKVLLVPRLVVVAGALLQEGVGDLVVDVLLCSTIWFASCTLSFKYCSRVAWQNRMSWKWMKPSWMLTSSSTSSIIA